MDRQLGRLLNDGFDGYRAFLLVNAAAIFPLEQALTEAGVDRILPDWSLRTRSAALGEDLAEIGAVPPLPSIAPETGGEAHQLGILYVLEGSRLGAKALARVVSDTADPRVRAASRFLRHGERERFWQTFLQRLENSSAAVAEPREVLGGARLTFELFGAPPLSPPLSVAQQTLEIHDGAR